LRQTGYLLAIDGLNNLVDYGFHIYLARVLLPGPFAVLQSINAAVLVLLTAFAVSQPVVARFVAESAAAGHAPGLDRSLFRFYFLRTLLLGSLLTLLAWWSRAYLASWLNVPEAAVTLGSAMLLLATIRPVVLGILQGRRQFAAFGLTRLANALARFGAAVILVGRFGGGSLAAVAALPLASFISLLLGLAAVGRVWRASAPLPGSFRRPGALTISAFLAFTAYMSLLSMDLIWVNRLFAAETAGAYAAAVLLRRVLALLPGAVVVVMYPSAVAWVAQARLPDRLLAQATAVIIGLTLLLTALYAIMGQSIIRWTFGADYVSAAPLLVGMGLGMVGLGQAAVWMNFYLATRPQPYVLLLVATALAQIALFNQGNLSLPAIVTIFAASGWLAALGGLLLYLAWLRPALKTAAVSSGAT
jgi:O-antigen/teichoic acid export membrane protein